MVLLETHLGAWRALTRSPNGESDAKPQNSRIISPPALIAAIAAFVGAYELEAEGNGVVVLAVHAGEWCVCLVVCVLQPRGPAGGGERAERACLIGPLINLNLNLNKKKKTAPSSTAPRGSEKETKEKTLPVLLLFL